MTKDTNIQWHPAFCSAFKLELREDAEYLTYTNEYNINTKPIQADLLIIKKPTSISLKNNLGKIFRGHNIIEYKSPDDALNLDTFIKVIGYACLYKASEKHVNDIQLDDITLTFVRKRTPRGLFKWLTEQGYQIIKKYEGIFYVLHEHCFPIQIIVSNGLSKKEQKWITLLHDDLDKEDIRNAIEEIQNLQHKGDKDNADSLLQIAIKKNKEVFEVLKKEDDRMCEALRELMEPEIKEALAKATEEGLRNGHAVGYTKGHAEGHAAGHAEGRAEGRAEGELINLFRLVQKNLLPKEIGAAEAKLSMEDFINQMYQYGYTLPNE